MKILVTGAAGVLGGGIVKRLKNESCHDVRGTDIFEGEGIEKADLCQQDQVQKVVDDAEVVIHCAAVHPWKKYTPDQYIPKKV